MNSKEFSEFYSDYINSACKFNLDITYKCPLECPFCVRQLEGGKERIKKAGEITLSEMKMIIDKATSISFCGQISDPIYHTKFEHIMKLVSKNPHKSFSINTNGTRKKPAWWKKMYSLSHKNVSWVFGLDGADQETANIYRVNTRFEEVLEAMKLGASMGIRIVWQFIVFKHNEHQIEDAKKIADEFGIELQILKSNRWHLVDIMKEKNIQKPSEQWVTTNAKQAKIIL
jgi:MoaA/NifB/PqqE/SkfB family radical SAM enzyme